MELDWLKKKVRAMNAADRMSWIERSDTALPLVRRCGLAGLSRASVYRRTIEREQGEEDLLPCKLIDEEHTRRPFSGSRRMVVHLKRLGHAVNRKRVERPNLVWSTDVTYIRLSRGFAYLVAIIVWCSRHALSWRLSNSMDASFCVDCLEDALRLHGAPEIFNSDQGAQFTSHAFIGVRSTGAGGLWTTSSWNGCGAASSMKTNT
jgi:putative transposase